MGEADSERSGGDARAVAIHGFHAVLLVCRSGAGIAVVAIVVQPNQQACHIPRSSH